MANRKCKFNEVSFSCNSSTMLKLKDKRQSMKHKKVLFSFLWTIKGQKCKTLGMEWEKKKPKSRTWVHCLPVHIQPQQKPIQ